MICPFTPFAFPRPCSSTPGGIVEVYVANPADLTFSVNPESGHVNFANTTGKPFYKWEVAENSGSLEATAQINAENGSSYFQNVLTAVLNGFDATTAGALLLRRLSRVGVIAKCRNGKAYYLGILAASAAVHHQNEGAKLTGLQISSGTQRADGNRATVTFTHESPFPPLEAITYGKYINA